MRTVQGCSIDVKQLTVGGHLDVRHQDNKSEDETRVLTVLQALSDPVRLEIVRQLAACPDERGMTCGSVEIPVTKATGTHHFKILLAAGIMAEQEDGNRKYIRLRRDELNRRYPGLIDLVLQP
jgi:DNA-binding transcriptional ArsR family regulator